MTASTVFGAISGSSDDFQQVVALCESLRDYCLIGGLAVNCYVEPVYTMDADFALAAAHLGPVKQRLAALGFEVEDHHTRSTRCAPAASFAFNSPRTLGYAAFPARAEIRETLGVRLRVAALADLVQAKVWSWSDPQRRLSKRKKTNSISFASRKISAVHPAIA